MADTTRAFPVDSSCATNDVVQALRPRLRYLIARSLFLLVASSACGGAGGKQDARAGQYCDAVTPCTEPGQRYCDIAGEYPASGGEPNTCIPDPQQQACSMSEPCTSDEKPHCTNSGQCVACLNFSHCTAETPICSLTTHTCGSCRSGDEGNQICAAIDPLRPFCSEAGGCVECLDNTACQVVSAPICDVAEFRCRGCTDPEECASGMCDLVSGTCEPAP